MSKLVTPHVYQEGMKSIITYIIKFSGDLRTGFSRKWLETERKEDWLGFSIVVRI